VTTVPNDLEGLLTEALKKRNFLTHHFFRERAELFMSRHGREKMIQELERAQKIFDAEPKKVPGTIDLPSGSRKRFQEPLIYPVAE
jgi:hypothetical protein